MQLKFNVNDFKYTQAQLRALLKDPASFENQDLEVAKLLRRIIKKRYQQQELKPYQAELIKMQNFLEQEQRRMIILFEGRDASGKSGTIRRIIRYINPKHYQVVALSKPSEKQKTQWYFQRYTERFPAGGEIVLFDRSWYTRALTEPVFGFCSPKEYNTFMRGVTGFEKDLVRQGTILIKLYFSVSKEVQAKRFKKRQQNPLKEWKLSEIDLQAQDLWDEFTNMKFKMLKQTHTTIAPWTIIRSDTKHKAHLNAIKVILNSVVYKDCDDSLDFVTDEDIVISGARELENMQREKIKYGKKSPL